MKLPTEIFGDVIVVHTPDEVTIENGEELEDLLTTLERSSVIVDMDGTELLDSGGLEAILKSMDSLRIMGGDLKVATDNAINRKIFEITRLDQQIDVHSSVLEAVKSFA
jgi:anti-sigma B factor antagonist